MRVPICCCMAMLALGAARVGAATIGSPSTPSELFAQLTSAYKAGQRDLTITPGLYKLPPADRDTLGFDGWRDTKIHARGVTMVFEDTTWAHRPVRFLHCKNVLFEGATLSLAIPAATQGRIALLGERDGKRFADWQIDAGYTADVDPVKSALDVVDQRTRVLKVGTGDFSPASVDTLAPGRFRMWFRGELPGFVVGDWLITRAGGGSVICHVDSSERVTLQGLHLQNGGFATLFETSGGSNRYLACVVEPGPLPAGASEPPICGCGADGFHSTGTSVGPDIEGCEFRGVFHDDNIAIHGSFHNVEAVDGTVLTLKDGADDFAVGQPVRISDEHGFFEQAICTRIAAGSQGRPSLTLDRAMGVPVGAKANNPGRCGRGFKILRCKLGNTRSRGILVKGDDGIIDGNLIEGCGMPAVSIGPEYYWGEANYVWNLRVAHNTFRQCQKNGSGDGTVFVHGDGAIGNRKITITDNVFDTCYGSTRMSWAWVDGLAVTNNRILCHEVTLPGSAHALTLAHAHHVTAWGNTIHDVRIPREAVQLGPDTPGADGTIPGFRR